ncbi:MAG: DMT family transporter [Candidatus Nanopelagicales bacterium]|nr:DMT family transporter [Candidatus Nanopelagicales bacterium]
MTNVAGSRAPVWIPMALCVAIGVMTAVQSRMNGELSIRLDNGIEAAVWSFLSGLAILVVILFVSRRARLGVLGVPAAIRRGDLRWWQILGGVLGGFFVAVQATVVPLIGVAVFTIAVVAGQSTNSLVVDRIGLGPAGKQPITWQRLVGAVLAVLAVTLGVSQRLTSGSIPLLPVVFAVLGGALIAIQGATNGRVSFVTGQPLSAAFLNFMFGSIVLGSALGVAWGLFGKEVHGPFIAPWWAYFGGVIGLVFIVVAAWSVPIIGVLMFALLTISGQLVGSMALDIALPTPGSEVTPSLVAGVLLAFVAIGITASNRSARVE